MIDGLYAKLKRLNIHVDAIDGKLDVKAAKGVITSEIINEIKENKDELIRFINAYKIKSKKHILIPKAEQQESYVMSSSQKRLWVLSQFEESNVAYNLPGFFEFSGSLDLKAFENAFTTLIERHEILRTVFREDENGDVKQFILDSKNTNFKIGYVDLQGVKDQVVRLASIVNTEKNSPFKLENGPLLRIKLIQLDTDRYLFTYVMHHIISDGWSMDVMMRELLTLFNVFSSGAQNPLPPLRIQYKDYAEWEQNQLHSEELQKHKKYWLEQFSGEVPILNLPIDKVRPTLKSYNGARLRKVLNQDITLKVKALSQESGATLFMGLLAGVNLLLFRYTGQNDIIIGTPIAGREHDDLEGQIGYYLNTLALRNRFDGSDGFSELLRKVGKTTLEGYEHQAYPFDALIENLDLKHDISRSALFDVMIVLQSKAIETSDEKNENSLGDIAVDTYQGDESVISKFELTFTFEELDDQLYTTLDYNTDIYSNEIAEQLFDHLEALLRCATSSPSTPIDELDFISVKEKEELLNFSVLESDYPKDKSIVDLFEIQVEKTPDLVALIFEDKKITYQELNERSNQFADYLRKSTDLKPDDFIGIKQNRSDELIISILGVLKSGAAYVPIDSEYPQERIDFILNDTNCKSVIDEEELEQFNLSRSRYQKTNLEVRNKPSDLAYVMYTSGSTGTPKGVMVEHRNVVRLVKNSNFVDLSENRCLLSTGSVSFDATSFEYWSMLLNGGTLKVSSQDVLLDNDQLAYEIGKDQIDIMWFTSGWLNQLVDFNVSVFSGLKTVLVGGDKLSPAHIGKLRATYPELKIINGYGPTENTTFSLTYDIQTVTDNIPVGSPISNSSVYILDSKNGIQPVGVIGEICVAGDGLARGYLNNPELTSQKFVKHPFHSDERMYKTGDLGRWLRDGTVEFAGRKDDQVKIRGYRIELGEIENVLQENDKVKSTVVIVRLNEGNEKTLIAYLIGEEELNPSDLRTYLKERLPAYMIPDYFIQLETFPLNSNGKVDKKALPSPKGSGMKLDAIFVHPRTESELKLAEIWSDILALEKSKISINYNFFEIGGHSLKATRLSSQIHKVFGVKLSLSDLFNQPILENQAELIFLTQKTNYSSISQVEVQSSYPLSSAQKRLWTVSKFVEANIAYNIPGFYQFGEGFNPDNFKKAFKALIARHEILRTVFNENEQGEPRQYIESAEEPKFLLKLEDLRSESNPHEAARLIVQSEMETVFDLSQGPLLKGRLLQVESDEYIFSYVMHHIISDGWSMNILNQELIAFYEEYNTGVPCALTPLRIQYKDYATWQINQLNKDGLNSDEEYWLNQFSGELPVLNILGDYTRPLVKTYNGSTVHSKVDVLTTQKLNILCQDYGATLFMGLFAGVTTLLNKYSHQTDLILGTVIAGRGHADLENQIGYYLNTVPLRAHFSTDDSFCELLENLREITLKAYEHQNYPFDELINKLNLTRDLSRSAMFDVSIVLQNTKNDTTELISGELEQSAEFENGQLEISKFDLSFNFEEAGDEIHLTLEYNTDIYSKRTIEQMSSHLQQLLSVIVIDSKTSMNRIDYLDQKKELLFIEKFNSSKLEVKQETTLVSLFEEQVLRTPDSIAVSYNGISLTYSELNERSNQLAYYLRTKYEVGANDLIGLKLDRSERMLISILGTLKSGAAYLPIDSEYPTERIDYMVEDSRCKFVLDQEELEMFQMKRSRFSKDNLNLKIDSSDLAYVIYTSGSTGNPKGVEVQHKGIVNTILSQLDQFQLNESDKCIQFASFSFDASVWETFLSLLSGASLFIPTREQRLSPEQFVAFLNENEISFATLPPTYLNQLDFDKVETLRTVITAGESPLYHKVKEVVKKADYYNAYGPTETSVCATVFKINKGSELIEESISIGSSISNVETHILDQDLNLVPLGVPGEICIGGKGLAKGYLNKPEVTEEKFVQHPFKPEERIYRTGDIGRRKSDGTIEFIGRKDDQVKVRGYRIELGEIESALALITGIDVAFALVDSKESITVFITGKEKFQVSDLKLSLRNKLPEFMIPDSIIQLDKLPLTLNGKVDKKALRLLNSSGMFTGVKYLEPITKTEIKIVEIWSDILNSGDYKIGLNDNFFDLGGNSIRSIRVASEYNKQFNVKLDLKELMSNSTVESHVELIKNAARKEFVAIERVVDADSYELSDAQRRLWVLSQFEGGSVAYNTPVVIELEPGVDVDSFKKAIWSTIDRHEILRTIFRVDESGNPYQRVLTPDQLNFNIDLVDFTKESGIGDRIKFYVERDNELVFDLENGPLIRASLLQVDADKYVFYYNMHHIISDGWSLSVLSKDVFKFYTAFIKGEHPVLPELKIQYRDYAAWQISQLKGKEYKIHQDYWKNTLSGVLPVFDLPSSHNRPRTLTYRGQSLSTYIDAETTNKLKSFITESGGTLFMGVIASWKALFHSYTGNEDIIVGTPIAGRDHSDLEDQIGFYVNTLVLRTDIHADESFISIYRKVKENTLSAYQHQMYPFDRLLEDLNAVRDTSRNAIFDVMVSLQNLEDNASDVDLSTTELNEIQDNGNCFSKFDIDITLEAVSDYLGLNIVFNTDVYSKKTIEQLMQHYKKMLRSLLDQPAKELGELEYISNEEKHRLLLEFNDTIVDFPKQSLVRLFEEQVLSTPDNIAVSFEGKKLTYNELNVRSNQLADYLVQNQSIQKNDLVGIRLKRSEFLIVTILGVLKSGAAYMPIDSKYSKERINYIMEDSKCKLVFDDDEFLQFNTVRSEYNKHNPEHIIANSDLAYILYTSGSTGNPKGVMIEHKALYNYVKWASSYYFKENEESNFGLFTSLSFDLTVTSLFVPLMRGGLLEVMPDSTDFLAEIRTYFREDSPLNAIKLTPSHLRVLLDEKVDLKGIQKIILGGEELTEKLLMRLKAQNAHVEIFNEYGPTETTVGCTVELVRSGKGSVSIGKPIANTQVYILGKKMELLPIGVAGEICIGGNGVARGYLNNEALTEQVFISNPYAENQRLYKTGDLARWKEDGNIEYIGRKDDQVKVRGYRVELGEIEAVLQNKEELSGSVVLVKVNNEGDNELVAYLVSTAKETAESLSSYLKNRLPHYMIPSYFIQLDEFPLTTNGKIDKKELPSPEGLNVISGTEYLAPRDETEEKLVELWQGLLLKTEIGINDDFFILGGHSMKATKLLKEIGKTFGVKVSLSDLFQTSVLWEQAILIKESEGIDLNAVIILNQENKSLKRSIYFIPPILGNPTIFLPLSAQLTDVANCYGLMYKGIEIGESLFSSIEDAARLFCDQILKDDKTEEFILFSYSMGGLVAFEVAKLLEMNNKSFQLIIVDKDIKEEVVENDNSKEMEAKWIFRNFNHQMYFDRKDETRVVNFLVNSIEISNKYIQTGEISSNIYAFESLGNKKSANMNLWNKFTRGTVEVNFIEGTHWEALSENNLEKIVNRIKLIFTQANMLFQEELTDEKVENIN